VPVPVRLVLFDLDGTLVDHAAAESQAVRQWAAQQGWAEGRDLAGLVQAWDDIAERHFPAYRQRRTSFQGQRRLRLRDFLPLVGVDPTAWSDERLDTTFEGYLRAYEAAWRAFPDAVPCLQQVRQLVRVAVLSNGDQAQQEDKVARTGLGPYVDVVLTSDLLGVAKPDPAAFTSACARLGVRPEQAAYVGDRLEVDALAAGAAGLRGIWLDRGGGHRPAGVEAVSGLARLPGLLGLRIG